MKNGFSFLDKCGVDKIKKVLIKIPVDSNGQFNLVAQKESLEKCKSFQEIKQKIEEYKKKINELNIEIKNVVRENISVKVRNIFNVISGSAFKKNLFTGNSMDIPIIRIQNISDKNPKFIYYPKSEKIDEKFLVKKDDFLLPLSGSFFRLTKWKEKGKFYLNQRVAKFSIKKEFTEKLDEEFVKTMINFIEDSICQMGYSANNNLRINDVKNIEILVPIDKNGGFDLQAQKQIAKKYKKIEEIKSAINIELNKITEIKIDFLK